MKRLKRSYVDYVSNGGLNNLNSHNGYKSHNSHNGFDNQYGHNSHNKFNASGQAGKGLILPKDLLLADISMVFYLQQFRDTVCSKRACLDDLYGCERSNGWNFSIYKNL